MNRFYERALESYEVGAEAHDYGLRLQATYFWYEYKFWVLIGDLRNKF